jgi:hypothetical protein
LRGGDLVEQRLELVIVVAVDQRDVDLVVLGQPLGAAQPGEAAADDYDVLAVVAHELTAVAPVDGIAAPIRSSR